MFSQCFVNLEDSGKNQSLELCCREYKCIDSESECSRGSSRCLWTNLAVAAKSTDVIDLHHLLSYTITEYLSLSYSDGTTLKRQGNSYETP